VPIAQYKENLKTIIQRATVAQSPRIILLNPPPVNEYQLEDFDASKDTPHPSRTASTTKQYASAAQEVGAALNVPVADLWSAFMKPTGWKEGQPLVGSRDAPNNETLAGLFTDGACAYSSFLFFVLLVSVCLLAIHTGLHLSPAGNRIVYEEIMKVIEVNWPDQTPEVLPMVFPSWTDAPK
jgi:lysophospholipase L1-like esterase